MLEKIKNYLKSKKFTKETAKRAVRTFGQAALAYVATNLIYVSFTDDAETNKSVAIGLIASAAAAGISAVMNLETIEESEDEING
jgi:hypothetical protein